MVPAWPLARHIASRPASLDEALTAMLEDELVVSTLGQQVVEKYVAAKRAEWDEYRTSVSQWELDQYLLRF